MIEIIPAIDLIEGKCVRLEQGDYQKRTNYNTSPLDVAKQFEDIGIKHLHLVDLEGAKAKHIVNWKTIETIASKTNLKIDFGGGIKSDEDIRIAFECGANQITGGSIAVTDKKKFTQWLHKYGNDKIILGADVRDNKIAINGWKEKTELYIHSFLNDYAKEKIKYVICTDISKDGMLQGTSIELYKKINTQFKEINLIASGGVTNIKDLEDLEKENIYGAIIGKAIYEGKITLNDLYKYRSSF